jgi:hypothetical protein
VAKKNTPENGRLGQALEKIRLLSNLGEQQEEILRDLRRMYPHLTELNGMQETFFTHRTEKVRELREMICEFHAGE